MPAPRAGSMAKNPISASSRVTASTDCPAVSNTRSSMPAFRRRANSRARSTDTPTAWPAASVPARMGLPRLMAARNLPAGRKAGRNSGSIIMAALAGRGRAARARPD
ncbi:Uncharacterised protein [Bordetella pertussis]|nr:Uncharacterised protein [Bordetella pertussis]